MTETAAPPDSKTRIVGYVLLFWVAYAAILVAASFPKSMVPERWGSFVWGTLSSGGILAVTLLLLRKQGRSTFDVGLRARGNRVVRFLVGAAFGLGVYALVLGCISLFVGRLHFTRMPTPDPGAMGLTVVSFLALSLMEELGFRGYPLRLLAASLGKWQAQAIVAAAFCLSHFAFGWSWQAVALGVLPSALLFGIVAIGSGDLVTPIAVHAALNVARWATGERSSPGLWSLAMDSQAREGAAVLAPLVGFVVTVVCAVAAWAWYARTTTKTWRQVG